MGFLEKFLERAAPGWMPYVYLFAFLGLVLFALVRGYVVSRNMLDTNKALGERMTAVEKRIDVLESDRDRHDERIEATSRLLTTILAEVLATPRKIADAINAAASNH